MIKNEYRRGLIMLRPIAPGYSGHVRLERRTLMGSMYFIVNLPDVPGEIRAVLAGQKNGGYYAALLGTLKRDGRGQATLAYSFDPRNIDGRPLEDYLFVIVARVNVCACESVLVGNVDGSREADFSLVEQAVRELLTEGCGPAADIPERPYPVAPPPSPGLGPCIQCPDRPEQALPIAPGGEVRPERPTRPEGEVRPERPVRPDGEVRPDRPVRPGGEERPERPVRPDGEERPERPVAPEDEEQPERPVRPGGGPESMPGPAQNGNAGGDVPAFADDGAPAVSAAGTAGIDVSIPWASAVEGIREYFAGAPAGDLGFEDDFVYVRAPMPEGSGFPYVMIGLETDDGRIEAVRFALPGRFSASPPAGLDGYVWMGGPAEGWWVLTVDPNTGEPVNFDD